MLNQLRRHIDVRYQIGEQVEDYACVDMTISLTPGTRCFSISKCALPTSVWMNPRARARTCLSREPLWRSLGKRLELPKVNPQSDAADTPSHCECRSAASLHKSRLWRRPTLSLAIAPHHLRQGMGRLFHGVPPAGCGRTEVHTQNGRTGNQEWVVGLEVYS
jgi:hypothetical protein